MTEHIRTKHLKSMKELKIKCRKQWTVLRKALERLKTLETLEQTIENLGKAEQTKP